MNELRIPNQFKPLPAQEAFRRSKATIRGFGGAMAGGKSRTICEEAFDWALLYPGIDIVIVRQVHVHITSTTRKTFMEQVLPVELRQRKDLVQIRQSGGQDFVKFLWNGSEIHFCGLDTPDRVFSRELGAAFLDEAHEMKEEDVVLINSRLRQRCYDCASHSIVECEHMPHRLVLAFNPSHPQHWLFSWFMLGGTPTEFGRRKEELFVTDGEETIGSAEFFRSRATDNPYIPEKYVKQNLAGMSKRQRRRYLDGEWEHAGGSFFDDDALGEASEQAAAFKPILIGELVGDLTGADLKDPPTAKPRTGGRLQVFTKPVRAHITKEGVEIKDHRYVVACDPSSGAAADYSAIQVVDVEEFEQVAEWQGKVDPDQLAEHAFLLACVYNGALLVPEVNAGWGWQVQQRHKRLIGDWRGPAHWKPGIYTRPILDKLGQEHTTVMGWSTDMRTRAQMLDTLEQLLRDGSVTIHGTRTLAEMMAFAIPLLSSGQWGKAQAQKGAHDDLVIALAIAVTVAFKLPRKVQIAPRTMYGPSFEQDTYSITGY